MDRVQIARKIAFFVIWNLVYTNFCLFLVSPHIYRDPLFLTAIVTMISISGIDTAMRPFTEKKDAKEQYVDKYSLYLFASFLVTPILYAAAFHENKLFITEYVPFWNDPIVSYAGIFLIIAGGLILITGRYQLGRFGSGVLVIEDDHELVTSGIFRFIRHPIYSGGLIVLLGIMVAFRSIIILIIVVVFNFIIMRGRMIFEEKILEGEFGDEFREYCKRTRRILPFVY